MVVFVLSPISDDLEALGRSGSSAPITIPASGLVRFVMTGQGSRSRYSVFNIRFSIEEAR